MNILNWVLCGITVGVGAIALYNGAQISALESKLIEAESHISSNMKDVTTLRDSQATHSETLSEIGSAETIADEIVKDEFDELVVAISKALTTDPEKIAILSGPVGPAPDMDLLIVRLLDGGLAEQVGYLIWQERYSELATMPQVLASVAETVYQTYGTELRGKDATPISPDEVARALALDPAFVSLLELELSAR